MLGRVDLGWYQGLGETLQERLGFPGTGCYLARIRVTVVGDIVGVASASGGLVDWFAATVYIVFAAADTTAVYNDYS